MAYSTPKFDPARDMRAPEFSAVLSRLRPHTPIADRWEKLRPPSSRWWDSQRTHMVAWFSQAEGPGAYGRRKAQTAGQTYNRLLCPPALLWIGEALGEDREVIRVAANAAWGQKRLASQCGVIRHHIQWPRILELARQQQRIG